MSEVILLCSVLIFILTIIHIKKWKEKAKKPIHKRESSLEYIRQSISDVRVDNKNTNDQKTENIAKLTTPSNKYKCDNLNSYNYQIMNFYTPITEEKISYIINKPSEIIQNNNEILKEEKKDEKKEQLNVKDNEKDINYKIIKLTDYIHQETTNFVIDLDDITHSLSKYHDFNNLDVKNINIMDDIVPKKLDYNLETVKKRE